jgi:SAM-dependent methyltransferase
MEDQGIESMKCLVCDSSTKAGLFAWHRFCPACRYESADLAPVINEAGAHDLVDERDREVALKSLRAENFKVIVELITRLVPVSAKRLLDVGSAHGWFLDEASKRFDVVGVEPDTVVAERAQGRGLPVRIGYFPDVLDQGELFDVIVFNDVIEHIPDINRALQASYDQLSPEGLLVLNLPRSSGVFYRIAKICARFNWRGPFERMWQKDLPSPHVHYFNEQNLDLLVTRHRFNPLQTRHLSSLSSGGLLERLRFVGQVHPVALYTQYLILLCAIPFLKLMPSDIVVCTYRKR